MHLVGAAAAVAAKAVANMDAPQIGTPGRMITPTITLTTMQTITTMIMVTIMPVAARDAAARNTEAGRRPLCQALDAAAVLKIGF